MQTPLDCQGSKASSGKDLKGKDDDQAKKKKLEL